MDKNKKIRTVAVIPAYDEEKTIAKVILLTSRYVSHIVVCDDGSTDMTAAIAKKLGATVLTHKTNRGKGEALRTLFKGIVKFRPDIVVTLDADGQHDPADIPKLVEPIRMGKCDMVIGSRYIEGAQTDASFFRRTGLRVINFLFRKVIHLSSKDTQSGFRAYSLKAFQTISSCQEKGYGVESEQLAIAAKNGLRIVEVPINMRYKGLEKTSKRFSVLHGGELIATIFRLVVEKRPLMYLGVPGALLASGGAGLLIYLLLLFNATRFFSIQIAMIGVGASLTGALLTITAVMLHMLNRIVNLIQEKGG